MRAKRLVKEPLLELVYSVNCALCRLQTRQAIKECGLNFIYRLFSKCSQTRDYLHRLRYRDVCCIRPTHDELARNDWIMPPATVEIVCIRIWIWSCIIWEHRRYKNTDQVNKNELHLRAIWYTVWGVSSHEWRSAKTTERKHQFSAWYQMSVSSSFVFRG